MNFDDYVAIEKLIHLYPDYADRGDIDAIGALFADAEIHAPGFDRPFHANGDPKAFADVYRQWVRIYPESGTPRTRHVISNIMIDFEGPNRARAQSYVMVFQSAPDFALQPIIGGTYRDRFAKMDGEWRFVERREDMELVGDLSRHLFKSMGGTSFGHL
jgi:hypothetical protein